MSEPVKPILPKPPGHRDPAAPPLKPPPARRPIRPILPTTYRPPKKTKSRKCCRKCYCATCIIILLLILLIAAAGCVFYLLFQPKAPVIHLQSVEFKRLNVTASLDGPVLNSEAVIRIEIRNQNSMLTMHYGKTDVSLKGSDVDLGKGSLPAFSQDKKNTTVLKLTTKVKGMLLDSGSGKKVRDGFKSKKLMMWTEVNTKIGVGSKGWNTVKVPIKAICEGVTLKDVDRGSSVPKCKISVFKLLNIKT